jgi:CRISPR/Cas system CSM-associated protein Csm3 (group 7 of RAMP superfamily)
MATKEPELKLTRRWMIEGTLVTKGPLHIGSGETTHRDDLVNEKTKAPVKIAAVAMGSKKPYIPGSTLKGNIRAWADRCLDPKDKAEIAFIDAIFGSLKPDEKSSKGGKVDFFDSHAVEIGNLSYLPPYWCEKRWTGVMTSTQINRRTRTVAEGKLFHTEYVPEGVSFEVRLGGQDADGEEGFDEITKLLALFEGFNTDDVSLGADTGDGWGLFDWKPDDIRTFDSAVAKRWVAAGCETVGYEALESIGAAGVAEHHRNALAAVRNRISDNLTFEITLKFDGSFLVDDPSRTGSGDDLPNHTPLLDTNGLLWLPASSFRGAFRSQAERILRTIGGDNAACYPDGNGPRKTCGAISQVEDVQYLCPACQIFGASGWRTPIEFSSFLPVEGSNNSPKKQEFVAIDRFTGAASLGDNTEKKGKGAKFDAERVVGPKLKGRMRVNFAALRKLRYKDAAIGLIALGLRDLIEGDIVFGMGASKGYGRCTAELGPVKAGAGVPDWVEGSIISLNRRFSKAVSENSENDFDALTGQIGVLHELLLNEPHIKPDRRENNAVS